MNNVESYCTRAKELLAANENLPDDVKSFLESVAEIEAPEIDFKEVVDCIDENIFITDGEGYVLYVNPAYTNNTGVTRSDVLHKYVKDIVAEGIFTGGSVMPVLETKQKAYHMATTYRSEKPLKGYTVGVPIFNEDGSLKLIVATSRTLHTLQRLKGEYNQFLSEVKTYNSDIEEVKIVNQSSNQMRGLQWISPQMQQIRSIINRVAPTDACILITGETGVGKEVLADEIYRLSNRSDKPFVKVNCAAIAPNLLESELFGYEKGAFSGADSKGKKGLIEMANHGTLMLDEIGDMPLDLQVKLLRVIQNQEIRRVGGTENISLDVRYIAATNQDLQERVEDGTFRRDLYYRLKVIPLFMPPLRERKDDLLPLCHFFVQKYNEKYHANYTLSLAQTAMLSRYNWPGNVRELENIIEYFTICRTGFDENDDYMLMSLLDININEDDKKDTSTNAYSISNVVENVEKHMIEDVLSSGMSLREAGKQLNMSASTLSRRIKKYQIEYPNKR